MSLLNVVLDPLSRLIAFFERRRGLAVVVLALVFLILGSTTAVIHRPPVLAPVVDVMAGGFLEVFSQPLKLARRMGGTNGSGPRLMQLELELALLREKERENIRLRNILGYESPPRHRLVPGRVIGLDLDPLKGLAWINVGSSSGLREGMPVLTVDGLVGMVARVSPGQSRVRLLRNENTPVSVRDTRSRVLGILEWDPGLGRLRVSKVPFQADMAVGDTLISSGLGGVFPPGLPVGVVDAVEEPPERLLKSVTLEPFGAFFRLEEVFVLETGSEWGPEPAMMDSLSGPGGGE